MGKILWWMKKAYKMIFWRPFIDRLGANACVMLPRKIIGKKNIAIGERTLIKNQCELMAISSYGTQSLSPKLFIGKDVYIGRYAQIHAMNCVTIEDGCVFSEYLYMSDISHGLSPENGLIMEQPLECKGPIHIKQHTFIGFGVRILPGVTLGEHCVVGAGAVVTKSFPAYSMLVGNPAKCIKKYNVDTKKWESV